MPAIKLVIGLGNPGKKYEDTRHNIGFLVLDQLASSYGAAMANHLKWRAHVAKVPGSGTILMKPQTFMNESGQSVGAALRFYKWEPEQILVVYDDVALPYGALRFRNSGSAGGHNGMKSIISGRRSQWNEVHHQPPRQRSVSTTKIRHRKLQAWRDGWPCSREIFDRRA